MIANASFSEVLMHKSASALGVTVLLASAMAMLPHCSSDPHINDPVDGGVSDAGADAGTPGDAGMDNDGGTPTDAGMVDTSAEKQALNDIAAAFRSFHDDTTGWPYGGSAWQDMDVNGAAPAGQPTEFTDNDTALFSTATLGNEPLPACSGNNKPCWGGPYLTGGGPSMGAMSEFDTWGHKRLFAILRPDDGFGGSDPSAMGGTIILWSAGPNGIDDTGCNTTDVGPPQSTCMLNYAKLTAGQTSVQGGDDVIVVVTTCTATNNCPTN